MLDPKVEEAINQQINKELDAWYTYLAMAAYFDEMHLNGFAAFMERQSKEEQDHAHRLFRYLLDRGGSVQLQSIDPPQDSYGSVKEVFSTSLAMEKANTQAIYELYDLARELNDYATVAHLQWFLDEQVEEEKVMAEALGLVEFAGDNKSALLVLNSQMSSGIPGPGGTGSGPKE